MPFLPTTIRKSTPEAPPIRSPMSPRPTSFHLRHQAKMPLCRRARCLQRNGELHRLLTEQLYGHGARILGRRPCPDPDSSKLSWSFRYGVFKDLPAALMVCSLDSLIETRLIDCPASTSSSHLLDSQATRKMDP